MGRRHKARPPSPSSNRPCGFPASGFHDNIPGSALVSAYTSPFPVHPVSKTSIGPLSYSERFSVIGHSRPIGTCPVLPNTMSFRLLRYTSITMLHHYYEPVRIPNRPPTGYSFPMDVDCRTEHPPFRCLLFSHATRNHAGEPGNCSTPFFTTGSGFSVQNHLTAPGNT